ncbi:fatty acyl-AMP ligase [Actinacidiphila paucisporea]|uniref:Acyl-CoA synthetase (AMP-forming)/AMP-acid ligase II n=1 Tax=Actinacidiphila paucisporea TaxID=310782 RepID=A0A1M7PL36_9ACTN|nr:fatty acyl-AMP ligase [Actinacidiphila paucisporea]SHN17977.1 Acyl-CoA synthetase (AMP-forming)/AMP-acid ligase II [Actinacidiphila paucisporea]
MLRQENFTEIVLRHAAELPDKEAFVFLPDSTPGAVARQLTYAALDAEARRIASWLQRHSAAGERVLLLYPSGLEFVKAFVGCLYAGAVAVPAPLPGDQDNQSARLTGILRDAGVRAVLTDSAGEPAVSAWLRESGATGVRVLAVDDPAQGDAAAWTRPRLTADSLAFLQYTSGSTSEPKGVMVSHRNLIANEQAISRALGTHEGTRMGCWLPAYHDMGLIGHILNPLYVGGSAALMSPVSFLMRPARWLQMITDHRVTVSGSPNFGYDLCLRRVTDEQLATLDLSSWEHACNGAEPVRSETVRAFTERFAQAGFRPESFCPCYGMAETTLLVSGVPAGRAPVHRTVDAAALEQGRLDDAPPGDGTRTLVGSGEVAPDDFTVKIVDPDSRAERPEGHVGEIWAKGASVAAGYWNRPRTNAQVFDAGIVSPAGTDPGWLRTGDLGAMDAGQLYVTGRLKEMILINGRNIYPHDVEREVQGLHPAFRGGAGAAFSVDDGEEHLVLVQEFRRGAAQDPAALCAEVRDRVRREFQASCSVVLVRPATVRKTTSGKIRRTLMRQLLLEDRLAVVHQDLDRRVADLAAGPMATPVG